MHLSLGHAVDSAAKADSHRRECTTLPQLHTGHRASISLMTRAPFGVMAPFGPLICITHRAHD